MTNQKPYHILSLDGGGTWSILQLLTLQKRFGNISGYELLRKFDLIAANSGGSIVLATLIEDWPLSKSIAFFEDPAILNKIFARLRLSERLFPTDYSRLFGIDFGPKYSTAKKLSGLRSLLKVSSSTPINQLESVIGPDAPAILIPTFDALHNRTKFFRSHSRSPEESALTITEIIHASSTAPVNYFDFPAELPHPSAVHPYFLWDGALGGFNNPVAAAVVEAIKMTIPRSDIHVLSLGTGNKIMTPHDQQTFAQAATKARSFSRWTLRFFRHRHQLRYLKKALLQVSKSILRDPPDWSTYIAWFMLSDGQPHWPLDRFIRLSPLLHITPTTNQAAASVIDTLHSFDKDATSEYEIEMLKLCHTLWSTGLILNQPISYSLDHQGRLSQIIGNTNAHTTPKLTDSQP